ncbi:hypothetical protein DQ04_20421000 [Trypanosoma grayi]|uniref:hypothetical protein n=1 Tax=Trypanosoma grayi TaxID=71804 RepID=UPI0004F458D2|nr:hypothetical protein DQ04_20421000 [Trypanosoma grayi]KEG05566.1 hypothetical protein DQ04_20421000 [Trypanosoma grayi]
MVDLVKAANFAPVQRWIKSLVPVHESREFGVVLMGVEVCSVKYDPDDANLVVEVRLQPVLHDAAGKRLRLSPTGDETIILKERTTRLLLIVERPGEDDVVREPMVVLERSVQLACAGRDHMQRRLPTVQISADGDFGGDFARAIQPALRITLNRQTTKQLLRPLCSNPLLGDGEEDVYMYVQQWHPDAHATLKAKLGVASSLPPPPPSSPPSPLPGQQQQPSDEAAAVPMTEGCRYEAAPLSGVLRRSNDAITIIAATIALRRRQLSQLPLATVAPQRPPTPLPPAPEPRPDLQPLYDARGLMQLAEEGGSDDDDDGENE